MITSYNLEAAKQKLKSLKQEQQSLLQESLCGLDVLAEVNRMAIQCNKNQQSIIESWFRVIERNAVAK